MDSPNYRLAQRGQESAFQMDYHPESQILVHMSPASYLRHCSSRYVASDWPATIERLRSENASSARQAVRERMLEGQPLDALFLDADPFTGAIITQEGIHRAIMAQDLGIALLPVLIYAHSLDLGYTSEEDAPGWPARLRALFDEKPHLSAEVSVAIGVGRTEHGTASLEV